MNPRGGGASAASPGRHRDPGWRNPWFEAMAAPPAPAGPPRGDDNGGAGPERPPPAPGPHLADVFRWVHPRRQGAYTCFNASTGAALNNHGALEAHGRLWLWLHEPLSCADAPRLTPVSAPPARRLPHRPRPRGRAPPPLGRLLRHHVEV